jgi:hypothetical protein
MRVVAGYHHDHDHDMIMVVLTFLLRCCTRREQCAVFLDQHCGVGRGWGGTTNQLGCNMC